MTLQRSFVAGANSVKTPFPLNNLPYGVFSAGGSPRCGVAIGDMIFDCKAAAEDGLLTFGDLFDAPDWTPTMARGPALWADVRARLAEILAEGSLEAPRAATHLTPLSGARLHMPFRVAEYTDFYSAKHHALNVGTMFRGPENALPPNWLHLPIGYNGRASSVVVSGTDVRRPWGQIKRADDAEPRFTPSRRFDIELELGAIVGQPSEGPLTVEEADANIFGFVLLNDWSARDIQAFEYQPLGPFQAKATATTISPWIVTKAALEPFRVAAPLRDTPLLPHLSDSGAMFYDIELSATLAPAGKPATTITRTNYREIYYSFAQQLANHTTSGCPMRVGDLLGSGTISGPTPQSRGSLLEISWGGREPLTLETGETRTFIEDGDTLGLHGAARGDGFQVGFGDCIGKVVAARSDPYKR